MQIAQLYKLGFQVFPVKEFNSSTSIEFDGSLEKFVYTTSRKRSTTLFMKSKTVGEILVSMLKDNKVYGYTEDMSGDLLSAMLYLSNLPTHKLELPQVAIEEIKYLKTMSCIQEEIIEYQLALPVDGILLKSPLYSHTWIKYFQEYIQDIVSQEGYSRIARITQHNAHLRPQHSVTTVPLAECA